MAGRPRASDTRARTKELLRLLTIGTPLAEAAIQAKVKPERVLRLLDSEEFFQVYEAVRVGRLGPTAVVLEADVEPVAA